MGPGGSVGVFPSDGLLSWIQGGFGGGGWMVDDGVVIHVV